MHACPWGSMALVSGKGIVPNLGLAVAQATQSSCLFSLAEYTTQSTHVLVSVYPVSIFRARGCSRGLFFNRNSGFKEVMLAWTISFDTVPCHINDRVWNGHYYGVTLWPYVVFGEAVVRAGTFFQTSDVLCF